MASQAVTRAVRGWRPVLLQRPTLQQRPALLQRLSTRHFHGTPRQARWLDELRAKTEWLKQVSQTGRGECWVVYPSGDHQTFKFPKALETAETLIICGFDETIARTIIVPEWSQRPCEVTLIEVATQYMRSHSRVAIPKNDEEWRADLENLGLSAFHVKEYMGPNLKDYHRGGGVHPLEWVLHNVKAQYDYLDYQLQWDEWRKGSRAGLFGLYP